jgi:hypothetical protein
MAQARIELDKYTMRVLDMVKGKHGLKNRNEALAKFVEEFGTEYAQPMVDEQVLKELDEIYGDHLKKNPRKKMSLKDLDRLLGLD